MMYSAMLLASLLASAHGFAATPTVVGNGKTFATHMECQEFAFDPERDYCGYPTCDSNEDCQGTLQCLCMDTDIPCPPVGVQKFCKPGFESPFCAQVQDGAGGFRYEVEC